MKVQLNISTKIQRRTKMLYRRKTYLYMIYIMTMFMVFYVFLAVWEKCIELLWGVPPLIIKWQPVRNNFIQCYSKYSNDVLKSVEEPDFSPNPKSIFFHETSCRGGIDSRQACAVESAARVHPDWEVYLLFCSPVTEAMVKMSCLVKLLQYPNVKLARIHPYSYVRNSPVVRVVSEQLEASKKAVQLSSDILKVLTLNRWGGVSLDLDMLVMKTFNYLPDNWIAKESPHLLASGAMRFSKDEVGQNLTRKVLKEMATTYNNGTSLDNGAAIIEKVLKKNCKKAFKQGECKGITIYGPRLFYPVAMINSYTLVNKGPWPLPQEATKPYTYCMWNVWTAELKVHPKSPFVHLAKKVCPSIYATFGDQFGI